MVKKGLMAFIIVIVVSYISFKIWRETCWVKRTTFKVDDNIEVKVNSNRSLIGFQDFTFYKHITIKNKNTSHTNEFDLITAVPELTFYKVTDRDTAYLVVLDSFIGYGVMHYDDLQILLPLKDSNGWSDMENNYPRLHNIVTNGQSPAITLKDNNW